MNLLAGDRNSGKIIHYTESYTKNRIMVLILKLTQVSHKEISFSFEIAERVEKKLSKHQNSYNIYTYDD